jgi:GNAT superfamily N-acetyltransferase
MSLPNCRFFALRSPDGSLSGAVIVNHEGRKGWINRLAVRPGARRTGIARILVRACEQWLHDEGIGLVAALVERDNTGSQALFAACGYDRDDTLVYFRKVESEDV